VTLQFGWNSQGQPLGRLSVFQEAKPLIDAVPIVAYQPDVKSLRIQASRPYPGNNQMYDLTASFEINSRDLRQVRYETQLGSEVINTSKIHSVADKQ
jgi:hypothetical protein